MNRSFGGNTGRNTRFTLTFNGVGDTQITLEWGKTLLIE